MQKHLDKGAFCSYFCLTKKRQNKEEDYEKNHAEARCTSEICDESRL
jgi:hypothetical protein